MIHPYFIEEVRQMLTQLKLYRLKLGLRQVDLAEKANLPQHRISLIERGIMPFPKEALALASAMEISIEGLFPGLLDNPLMDERLNPES
jgi:transcriptional regulator with XRE-family HTH domain